MGKPSRYNNYNLSIGDVVVNAKGYEYTIISLEDDLKAYISFRPDKEHLLVDTYKAFKGRINYPYAAEDFVGESFTTPRGGLFKITGMLPREYYLNGKMKNATYTATCSVCSKDEELNPEEFLVNRSNMVCRSEISFPCQCNKANNMSEYQYKVLLNRKLSSVGLRVLSWWGEYINRGSKVNVVCKRHNHILTTDILSCLSFDISLCRYCRLEESLKELVIKYNKDYSKIYNTEVFDITCYLDHNNNKRFNLKCDKCIKDDYYRISYCDNIFELPYNSIVKKMLTCRCTPNKTFDEQERLHQIRTIMKQEGGYFRRWSSGYKNHKSKFIWFCKEGHKCETSVDKFVNRSQRCKTCSNINRKISWSFQEENIGNTDYLYFLRLYKEGEDFVKIGRTNNPKRRFNEYSCKYNLEVVKVYKGVYEDIWHKEKHIHENHKSMNYQPAIYTAGFSKECYVMDILNENFELLTSDLKDHTYKYSYLSKER